jgi:hypothetical protein
VFRPPLNRRATVPSLIQSWPRLPVFVSLYVHV